MNIRQANYILTILQEGSISAAAKKLFISQPALSQTLRLTEKLLGAAIFRRDVTPMQLTFAGERYIAAAQQILQIDENLKNEISEINQEEKGRLCFGISRQRGIGLMPAVISRFRERFPHVELVLEEHGSQTLQELAVSGVVDIALASADTQNQELLYSMAEPEHLVLLCDPKTKLAKKIPPMKPIKITDAAEESFVLLKRGHGVRGIQDRVFAAHSMSPNILLETDSFETAMRVAASCNAVMMCPHVYLRDDAASPIGGVVYPLEHTGFERSSYFCWKKGSFLPIYAKFLMELIEDHIKSSGGDNL